LLAETLATKTPRKLGDACRLDRQNLQDSTTMELGCGKMNNAGGGQPRKRRELLLSRRVTMDELDAIAAGATMEDLDAARAREAEK
jgi:hypothetical protein